MIQNLKQEFQRDLPVWKKSLIAGGVCMLLIHLYPMLNQMTTHDGVLELLGRNDTTKTGRWLLTYATYATTKWAEMPWVIGIWSIVFLALAVGVVVNLLQIRRTAAIWACAGLMTSFPVIACTFAYKFTAADYFLALLLAAGAAWLLARQSVPSTLLGILLLTVSMAIYQAYISLAVGLMIAWAILQLAKQPDQWKLVLRKSVVAAVSVAGSGVLYVVGLKVMLRVRDIKLTSYRGVNEMGKYTLNEIPGLLRTTWQQTWDFITGASSRSYMGGVTIAMQCALLLLGVVALAALIVNNKAWRHPMSLVILALALVALPFGVNCIQLLNKSEPPHLLMIYGFAVLYLLAVALIEHWYNARQSRPRTCVRVLSLLLCAGMVYHFALLSNMGYLRQQISMITTEQFANRVVMRLEEQESFGEAPVMFVGGFSHAIYPITNDRFARTNLLTGLEMDSAVGDELNLRAYIQNYLQVKLPSPSADQRKQVLASQEFVEMPLWPAAGSVAEIDGVLVVKFREEA